MSQISGIVYTVAHFENNTPSVRFGQQKHWNQDGGPVLLSGCSLEEWNHFSLPNSQSQQLNVRVKGFFWDEPYGVWDSGWFTRLSRERSWWKRQKVKVSHPSTWCWTLESNSMSNKVFAHTLTEPVFKHILWLKLAVIILKVVVNLVINLNHYHFIHYIMTAEGSPLLLSSTP